MGIHDSEDMVSFLRGQPRDNGRITGLEAFWGTPVFMAYKGMLKRWQSSEGLWLSEPNNQLQEGTRLGWERGLHKVFYYHLEGEGQGRKRWS